MNIHHIGHGAHPQTMVNLSSAGHVLYISSADVSLGDGPGVNEREFVSSLFKAIGDRAHFLIPRPASEVADLPTSACTFTRSHRRHDLRHFPFHIWSQMRLADKLLSGRRFDLIVFRLDILPLAPLYITRKHPVPFAIKTLGQGLLSVFTDKLGHFGRPLAWANRSMVRQLASRAIAVDTVSALHVQYLERTLGIPRGHIACIDNAVNTERFYPASAAAARTRLGFERFDPIIGYAGALPHKRGGLQLIRSVPMLLSKYPRLGIVILGNGNGQQRLVELARELGVEDHCIFTGHVPFKQVPIHINAFDVGVSFLPPRFQAQSELKVRQYLACGKPVVASTPGSNDFLQDHRLGSLVQYDDTDAISTELDRWLSLTADERTAFSRRAFQYASECLSVEQSVATRMDLWTAKLRDKGQGLAD